MKRPQNIIAESGLTLPVAALFSVVVWLLVGLVRLQLWPQLACFIATIYMVVEMTNQNALLRIRSRMVSSTFIVLSCASCFLFPQMTGGVAQLCMVAAFLMLFQTYQTSRCMGRIFYAFAAIGLGSLAFVQMLWYVPVLWLLMATQLQSMNWRTWLASMLGLAMPYWFALVWFLLPFNLSADWTADLSPLADHFALLADISRPSIPTPPYLLGSILALVLTLILGAIGITHFWQYSFEDKIRIRLTYAVFMWLNLLSLLFLLLQPQHCDMLLRLMTICTAPLIGHFIALTRGRITNIVFVLITVVTLAMTVFNIVFLWMP